MTTKKGTKYSKHGRSLPGHPVTYNPPCICSVRVIIMQRCLKNKTGQTLSLALIVAVTDGQTHHHTSVISTSSIFSAGLRWFCVGGGGAARTWAGNHHMDCQSASWFSAWSIQTPTSHLSKDMATPGLSEILLRMCFQLNFHNFLHWEGPTVLDEMWNSWFRFLPRLKSSWAQESL